MTITRLVQPFDHIAGCSLGTWTRESSIVALLDFIQAIDDSPLYNEFYPTMAKYWREFAMDLMTDPDNLDMDYYSDLVVDLCSEILPVSCSFSWDDGEFRIRPYIDDCLEKFAELPQYEGHDYNPANDEFIYLVNDHGNVDCYLWQWNTTTRNEWVNVWSMV